jgi:16S rRNA (cytosine1402-N4)-methyltransferase
MEQFETQGSSPHVSVLYQEIIQALIPVSSGKYVDGTLGAGGHASGILEASSPTGLLLGLDLDAHAIALARLRLAEFGSRAILRQASYASLKQQLEAIDWRGVNGIVLDLGLSSMQLDTPERGFSFQAEGPLDMRFDTGTQPSAADLVNDLPEAELADLIWKYGEEPSSRRIARAIVKARPLTTTRQLAAVVAAASRKPPGRIHPATRVFQALRIAVNWELESLESFLPQAVAALVPGGRVAIISFHSLEDRIVKHFFRQESRDCICPPGQPVCTCGHIATLNDITRHPIQPGEDEIARNPRARSARLRIAEKR